MKICMKTSFHFSSLCMNIVHSVLCFPNTSYFSDFCNHRKDQSLQRKYHVLALLILDSLHTLHFQNSKLLFPASCSSEYYLPVKHYSMHVKYINSFTLVDYK